MATNTKSLNYRGLISQHLAMSPVTVNLEGMPITSTLRKESLTNLI
jgi:hypothetical protein